MLRLSARSTRAVWGGPALALLLLAGGCEETKNPPAGAEPAAATPEPEAFDGRQAIATIAAHIWEGVVGGKPTRFVGKEAGGRLGGVIEHGEERDRVLVRIERDRRILIRTDPRPVAGGLSHLSLSGKLNQELTEISGTAKRVLKQGLVEQATGMGDFRLKRGVLRAQLAAREKAKILKGAKTPSRKKPDKER